MSTTPYFETVKSFADVPITDDGIETQAFLEAADGLVGMFDLLGIGVLSFVQNDIRGNVSGVRDSYTNNKKHTLESLLKHECETSASGRGIGCLVRLIRGLYFTHIALRNAHTNPSATLHASFKHAYDVVLRKHHNFVIRSTVYVALLSLPTRTAFYARICQGARREKLNSEMTRWLDGLNLIASRMKSYLESNGYGRI